jgi:adenosylcobalamin-dependent ribonucleoside-triphosphate reductase
VPLSDDFLARYQDKTPPWGFRGLGYIVYKRTYARLLDEKSNVTEEWWQTLHRVVDGAEGIGADLTEDEAERLFDYMFNLKASVGGRMLWQLGTPNNERLGGDSLVNCWYVDITKPEDFSWMFERLMLGGGVGFSVTTPEAMGVVRQGIVQHVNEPDADLIVPDKREGWSQAVLQALRTYLGGEDDSTYLSYNTSLIRPAGAPIRTFGGKASGPGILVDGIEKITAVLNGAVGRHLTSVEVLDIGNIIGSVVVAGNVRRSAEIALGRPDDVDYLNAKRWDLGTIPMHRAMSNNSVVVDDIDELPEEFWEGYNGNGEPYGLFNLTSSRLFGRVSEVLPDKSIAGTNPCAEIGLANRESCNLSEIFLPNVTSEEELVDISKLLYKVQKAVAAMPYLDRESDAITSQNMRLGLGVTGIAQAQDKVDWLDRTYSTLREFDRLWSEKHGWPVSKRLTTVKPSGTLSLLAGVTPGVHPGYSRYHIRRVRMSVGDPLLQYCADLGYHVEWVRNLDDTRSDSTKLVEFPCEFPEGTVLAETVSAIKQMQIQQELQSKWADNAVSVTVYIKPGELDGIREYLRHHWATMKSVSFLPHSDHGFDQAPLEEITKDEYLHLVAKVVHTEEAPSGGISELLEDDCLSGACPIR